MHNNTYYYIVIVLLVVLCGKLHLDNTRQELEIVDMKKVSIEQAGVIVDQHNAIVYMEHIITGFIKAVEEFKKEQEAEKRRRSEA